MSCHANPRPPQAKPRRAQAGLTLVETAIVASVLAAVAGISVPSFQDAVHRPHLEGAAAQLETDIHYTRMLAVAGNAPLRISLEPVVGGSCYVIHTGTANQCSCAGDGPAVCQGGGQDGRSVFFRAGGPVSLKSNSRSVVFDATKGTSTPTATMQLMSRNGMTLCQVMNIMGQVRSCSPAPAPGLSGYRPC